MRGARVTRTMPPSRCSRTARRGHPGAAARGGSLGVVPVRERERRGLRGTVRDGDRVPGGQELEGRQPCDRQQRGRPHQLHRGLATLSAAHAAERHRSRSAAEAPTRSGDAALRDHDRHPHANVDPPVAPRPHDQPPSQVRRQRAARGRAGIPAHRLGPCGDPRRVARQPGRVPRQHELPGGERRQEHRGQDAQQLDGRLPALRLRSLCSCGVHPCPRQKLRREVRNVSPRDSQKPREPDEIWAASPLHAVSPPTAASAYIRYRRDSIQA